MVIWATIIGSGILAVIFGWAVPLVRVVAVFQPLIVAISIMMAAILVRLNRGMPTLDWKSLDPNGRSNLTKRIVELNKEYLVILFIYTVMLVILTILVSFGQEDVDKIFSEYIKKIVSGFVGGYGFLCIMRMGYVVWRDYDIVKLQKKLIDDAGLKEQYELEIKSATDKVANIRSTNPRRVGGSDINPWT